MVFWWILLTIFALASAGEDQDDHGEYGHYNLWRKTMCERGTDEIYQDLENCIKLEPQNIRDTWLGCFGKSSPDSEGKMIPYMKEACENKSIFFKMDECLEENEFVLDEMNLPEEEIAAARACYKEVVTKNGMPELLTYFNEDSHEKK